jgi:hypothetical protein
MRLGPFIHSISDDDNAVKVLFDHVRNLGICAVVFAATVWKYNNMEESGWIYYFDWLIIILLVALGLFLYIVNQWHGLRKLRESSQPEWLIRVFMNVYSVLSVTIALSIIGVSLRTLPPLAV